jgi:hypothetical protein
MSAGRAELLKLQPGRGLLLVLGGGIVAILAFVAL